MRLPLCFVAWIAGAAMLAACSGSDAVPGAAAGGVGPRAAALGRTHPGHVRFRIAIARRRHGKKPA
ncbi:MAG TPA: hypothetical protein VMH02_04050, partial [Verrucomicrobiae bacterium]|nr:hypothetical protein [Verrucomicrobiae bacterium]